ncbi:hypothetical protein RRG08_064053 [Elysia crispata]|uniref:Uncharacterized protein n=1 Tax=Elysia crispata TaxID=231223 RepID=A0AAE1CY61_9GAST|nr:hypothetical protein RRG08_064053 [Elysia crispata]
MKEDENGNTIDHPHISGICSHALLSLFLASLVFVLVFLFLWLYPWIHWYEQKQFVTLYLHLASAIKAGESFYLESQTPSAEISFPPALCTLEGDLLRSGNSHNHACSETTCFKAPTSVTRPVFSSTLKVFVSLIHLATEHDAGSCQNSSRITLLGQCKQRNDRADDNT